MFEPDEKSGDRKGGSLLSLVRASRQPAAAAPSAAADDGPAARHRRARSRREARPGALMSALAAPPREEPAPESPVVADPPPQSAAPRVEPVHVAPLADPAPARFHEPAGDYWRPLIDVRIVLDRIWRSRRLIASTTLAGAALGVMLALGTPKQYVAISQVQIFPRDLKLPERELSTADFSSDAVLGIIENESHIMTSGPVLSEVVKVIGLEKEPEFNGHGGSRMTALLNPISLVRSLLSRSDAATGGEEFTLAVEALAERIHVERLGKSYTLNVAVTTENPDLSARIANTLVEKYMIQTGKLRSETAARATTELSRGLDDQRKAVEQAEDAVVRFKIENDIVDPQGRSIADDEIVRLNDQLVVARARQMELKARAQTARQVDVGSVVNGALPEGMASGVLTELRSQYAAAKQGLDSAAVRLGPRHPQLQALQAQLAGVRDQIGAELRRLVAAQQVELRRSVELEQDLAARLAQLKVRRGDTSQELVKLRELERDANTKRSVYESMLQRARETGELEGVNTANNLLVSPADPPLRASGPSRAMIAGGMTGLGLLAGLGLAALLGAFDSLRASARTRREDVAAAPPHSAPPGGGVSIDRDDFDSADEADEGEMYASYPQQPYPMNGAQPAANPAFGPGPGHNAAAPQPAYAPAPPPAYAPPPYPQAYAAPAYPPQPVPQPHYPQPAPAYPPPHYPQAYPVHPQPAVYPYAPAQHYAPAPPTYPQPVSQPPVQGAARDGALNESLDEIRAAVRECRAVMLELAGREMRRYR